MIVVSDSTILIGLAKIEKIALLRSLFQVVYIPEAVFQEVTEAGEQRPGALEVKESEWIIKKAISDHTQVNLLLTSLERGEAEVLVLAKEMKADLILLDEEKSRKSAVLAGFKIIGLIGVLIIAKQMGLIKNIKSVLEHLQKENFRLSNKIVNEALKRVGE